MRIALVVIVVAAMVSALFDPGTGSDALGAGGALTFEPDEIVLANIGDTAEVTLVHSGLGELADSVQLHLRHDESVAISDLSCIGSFAGATALNSSQSFGGSFTDGTLLGCTFIPVFSAEISGSLVSFTVERLAPGDLSIPLISTEVSGIEGHGTLFSRAGSVIDPGTLGTLSTLTSAPSPTPIPTVGLPATPTPTATAVHTPTPTPASPRTPSPASTPTRVPSPTPTPATAPVGTSTQVPDPSPSPLPATTVAATPTPSSSGGPPPTHTPPPQVVATPAPLLVTATAFAATQSAPTVIVNPAATAPPATIAPGGSRPTPAPAPTAQPGTISPTSVPTPLPVPTPAPIAPEPIAQQPEATAAGGAPERAQDPSPTVQATTDEAEEPTNGGTCNGTDGGLNMGILGILGLPALIGARKLKRNG